MEVGKRRAVGDADDRCIFQSFGKQLVRVLLARFVQRRGSFVEEQPCGLLQQRSGDGYPLLFAAGELLRPVMLFIKPVHKPDRPAAVSASRNCASLKVSAAAG